MNRVVTAGFYDELVKIGIDKEALLKELVRIGAKDIPGTPRLVMKHRGKVQRAALGESAEALWKKKITDPMMGGFEKGLKKLPEGKARDVARKAAETVAGDPLGGALTVFAPGGVALPFAKRGLKKAINVIDPV